MAFGFGFFRLERRRSRRGTRSPVAPRYSRERPQEEQIAIARLRVDAERVVEHAVALERVREAPVVGELHPRHREELFARELRMRIRERDREEREIARALRRRRADTGTPSPAARRDGPSTRATSTDASSCDACHAISRWSAPASVGARSRRGATRRSARTSSSVARCGRRRRARPSSRSRRRSGASAMRRARDRVAAHHEDARLAEPVSVFGSVAPSPAASRASPRRARRVLPRRRTRPDPCRLHLIVASSATRYGSAG